MKNRIKKIASVIISSVIAASSLCSVSFAADVLKSYNFNSDTSGKTPNYIEGNAVVTSGSLDASSHKKASFKPPSDAQNPRFTARVKANDVFLIRLYDGVTYEEFRVLPKSTGWEKLFVVLDKGKLSIVCGYEIVEMRQLECVQSFSKIEIENAVIDDVKIGEQTISAMPVNFNMYHYNDKLNLDFISFAPDGGKAESSALSVSWYGKNGAQTSLSYINQGLAISIPDFEYVMCDVAFPSGSVTLDAKKTDDLDVLVFDYAVSTGYNSSSGVQDGITLKAKNGSSWKASPIITDWSDYDELVIRTSSRAATGRNYQLSIYANKPGSTAYSYFYDYFTANWGGAYNDVIVPVGNESSINSTGNVVWSNVTGASLGTSLSTYQRESGTLTMDERESGLTIGKVFLRKNNIPETYKAKEYIINAQKRNTNGIDYAESLINTPHPRMILTESKLESLKSDIVTDEYLKKTFEVLKNNVSSYINKGVLKEDESDRASQIAVAALVYNLAPDEKIKNWIDLSIDGIIASERREWNYGSTSYLQVGDTMRAIAVAYDWMYKHWDDDQRLKVRNGIMYCGIRPAIRTLRGGMRWAGADNGNWNQSLLSGIGMGILAICDRESYRELANELLDRVTESLKYGTREFDEKGSHAEGVAYWHYAMDTMIPFEAALSGICGTNNGILDEPKMALTGYFPVVMTGSQGIFSFADAFYPSNVRSAAFYRLSEYFDNPAFGGYQYGQSKSIGGDYLSLLLYDTKGYDSYTKYLPNFYYYPGKTESFVMRKGWTNAHSYLAFKGGQNGISHSQLDIGTFVYDHDNVRWICDLGRDSYDDYNNKTKYYRNRAEGNNCVVINPDTGIDQVKTAFAQVVEHKVGTQSGYGIIDMSDVYEDAKSVKRGFLMTDNFNTLVIQDEISNDTALNEVYSFFHTEQKVVISPDGTSAVMTPSDGRIRTAYVKLISNCGAKLSLMDAQLLKTTPSPVQFDNSRYKKLAVKAENVKNPTFTLIISKTANPGVTSIIPMSEWDNAFFFGETFKVKCEEDVLIAPAAGINTYKLSTTFLDDSKIEDATYSIVGNHKGISINKDTITVSPDAEIKEVTFKATYKNESVTISLPITKSFVLIDGEAFESGRKYLAKGSHTLRAAYGDSRQEPANIAIAHYRNRKLINIVFGEEEKSLTDSFVGGDSVKIFVWNKNNKPLLKEIIVE